MAPQHKNPLHLAHPIFETPEVASGSYNFHDAFLSPEVQYYNYPRTTEIKIGGRVVEIPLLTSVRIRLLEPEEDPLFWVNRTQHKYRVNLGDFHRDFGDVEVAYSATAPCTHIWFAGYVIHVDSAISMQVMSYNATISISPEDVLPPEDSSELNLGKGMEIQYVRRRVRKTKT